MAILAGADSRVLIQGIEQSLARFQCEEMRRHGTKLAGVIASRPGETVGGVPEGIASFQTARQAVETAGANLSMVFSPPLAAKAAVCDAIEAGIPLIVCLTEHVPIHDAVVIRHLAKQANVTLIGPNSSGLLSPGLVKAGFFSEDICMSGDVGVITKSGSLAYAVLAEMKSMGIGITTVVAIGSDTVKGVDFLKPLALFQSDPDTKAIVLLGEIGGGDEEDAAAFIRTAVSKPVAAFVSGRSVPIGRSMGHAGAIAERGRGDYGSKIRALSSAGVQVAGNIGEIVATLRRWRI